jgi:hypothetical protein
VKMTTRTIRSQRLIYLLCYHVLFSFFVYCIWEFIWFIRKWKNYLIML